VGPELEEPPGRVHHVLRDLARHDDLADALPAEGANHRPEPRDADRLEARAKTPKLLGRLVADPDATHGQALPLRRFGKKDREPPAPGQRADRRSRRGTPCRLGKAIL